MHLSIIRFFKNIFNKSQTENDIKIVNVAIIASNKIGSAMY